MIGNIVATATKNFVISEDDFAFNEQPSMKKNRTKQTLKSLKQTHNKSSVIPWWKK